MVKTNYPLRNKRQAEILKDSKTIQNRNIRLEKGALDAKYVQLSDLIETGTGRSKYGQKIKNHDCYKTKLSLFSLSNYFTIFLFHPVLFEPFEPFQI